MDTSPLLDLVKGIINKANTFKTKQQNKESPKGMIIKIISFDVFLKNKYTNNNIIIKGLKLYPDHGWMNVLPLINDSDSLASLAQTCKVLRINKRREIYY